MPPFRTWALLVGAVVGAAVVAVAVSRFKLLAKLRVLARAVRFGGGAIDQVEEVPPPQVEEVPPPLPGHG
jgi:hypothetical protein